MGLGAILRLKKNAREGLVHLVFDKFKLLTRLCHATFKTFSKVNVQEIVSFAAHCIILLLLSKYLILTGGYNGLFNLERSQTHKLLYPGGYFLLRKVPDLFCAKLFYTK